MRNLLFPLCLIIFFLLCCRRIDEPGNWPVQKARSWYASLGWLRGCNFIPSTAVNQLEMWQPATFDTATIDRELGYAENIGMNSMRVYLHHVPWVTDPRGFKQRISTYLDIAARHRMSTVFVFFDDCWNNEYSSGPQPAPIPGVHNSRWVQDPGIALLLQRHLEDTLRQYVKDIVRSFRHDPRVIMWDLYNEPGSFGDGNKSLPLLKKVFRWAREEKPMQPLTAGVWDENQEELNRFMLSHSDVITYHNYQSTDLHRRELRRLQAWGRPLICTEYMARTLGSRFDNIMPMLKKEMTGAYSWGLVAGKTNTIYAQGTPLPAGVMPNPWYHDIFYTDGRPYSAEEIKVIRGLTGR
jgi:hypothetical protein